MGVSKRSAKKALDSIFTYYLISLGRSVISENTHNDLSSSIRSFGRLSGNTQKSLSRYSFVKDGVSNINDKQLLQWDYFHEGSQLVFLATGFDAFLSDISGFFYGLYPGSMGKDINFSIDELLPTMP